ncbi:MAG: type IV secretory pathway VirB6-like protein [Myxococcota bacterium]|jgi:type IV secretory pathway VirB6-like protein
MTQTIQATHISNKFLPLIRSVVFGCLLFVALFYSTPSYADRKDQVRACSIEAGVSSDDHPDPTYPIGLNYSSDNGGTDFSFDASNFSCIATILPSYVALKTSIALMNSLCDSGSKIGRPWPSPIHDSIDITVATAICGYRILSSAAALRCCSGVASGAVALAGFMAAVKIKHTIAQKAYEDSSLCGNGDKDGVGSWTKWNSTSMTKNIAGIKGIVEVSENRGEDNEAEAKNERQWYYGGVEKEDISDQSCADVNEEWVDAKHAGRVKVTAKSGKEYPAQRYYMRGTDPGNYACDRFNYRLNTRNRISNNITDYEEAHRCCIDKSKSHVCIERKSCNSPNTLLNEGLLSSCAPSNVSTIHKFCEAGKPCSLGGFASGNVATVNYAAKYSKDKNMICVSSSNMCPYDFNIGGGSEDCDHFRDGIFAEGEPRDFENFTPFDNKIISSSTSQNRCADKSEIREADCSINKKANKCKNYCQILNHCVILGASSDYIYDSSISSPYFSSACINFIGDSKNKYAYGEYSGQISIIGTQRHFSAPIAQCFKETIENVFYGKAGHTKCAVANEQPDRDGICPTDSYRYQQGKQVDEQSFFSRIQDNLKDIIKLVLTISIMMQGFKILVTGEVIKRQDLIMYIAKIGLVMFFATGTAWQGHFFDGVYSASSTLSNVVYKSSSSLTHLTGGEFSSSTMDGCQFGEIKLTNGTSGVINSLYPKGKEYLAVFDSLDCKIARYLGFGPEATVATIAILIIPALISPVAGGIGIFFAILTMIFGIFMIIVAIRTLHIFIFCSLAIILLVYVSPLTITAILFDKTKGVFDKWITLLISYSLQPMILFAYIGFFIAIFETLVTGSATFTGTAPQKEMVCDKVCVDRNGNFLRTIGAAAPLAGNTITDPDAVLCDFKEGEKELDPMSDSVVCMMNMNNSNIKSNPALAPFGIGLSMMNDLVFSGEAGRQKVLTMIKSVIIVYILAGFLSEIPALAANITGGNPINSKLPAAGILSRKAFGVARGAQKRAAGAVWKAGASAMRKGRSKSDPKPDSKDGSSGSGGDAIG